MKHTCLFERAITEWGVDSQKNQAIEELAELIQAINKHRRLRGNIKQIHEEMADVEIMLEQLRLIYPDPHGEIETFKEYKLERLAQVLNSIPK